MECEARSQAKLGQEHVIGDAQLFADAPIDLLPDGVVVFYRRFPGARDALSVEFLPEHVLRRTNVIQGDAMTGIVCHRQQRAVVAAVQVHQGEAHIERHRVVSTL